MIRMLRKFEKMRNSKKASFFSMRELTQIDYTIDELRKLKLIFEENKPSKEHRMSEIKADLFTFGFFFLFGIVIWLIVK